VFASSSSSVFQLKMDEMSRFSVGRTHGDAEMIQASLMPLSCSKAKVAISSFCHVK